MPPVPLKNGTQSIVAIRGGKNTKIHPVAASDRIALVFLFSAGQCYDALQGRLLLDDIRLDELAKRGDVFMTMDRGYEDDNTHKSVFYR